MRILFLTTHLNTGGISIYLLNLTKGLVKKNVGVHVVSSGGNMEDIFEEHGAKLLKLNIKTKSEVNPKIYFALSKITKYIKDNKIDIIHANTRITQVMACLLRMQTKVKYVSTCHGFFKPRLFRKIARCWGENVIAISHEVKEHLINDFSLKKNMITLIENGIDIDNFPLLDDETKNEKRTKYRINDDFVIGIIARLSKVKGQDILIAAMKSVVEKFSKAKLLIVGEGRIENQLKRMVKNLKLEQNVEFYPVINNTFEMLSLLDLFVMPSRQEGLGISIIEAQAVGLPVIATRVGGIPNLIIDGKTGFLVEGENIEDLSKKIIEIIENKKQLKEIGLSAREFVKNRFSACQMVDKTYALYLRMMR